MLRKYLPLIITAVALSIGPSRAQTCERGFDLSFKVGDNIGFTSPVPVPSDLKITGYNPKFNPRVGVDLAWFFNECWGIGIGVAMDWKGLTVHTRVNEVHLSIDVPNLGTVTGDVTGRNKTTVRTLYLTQPIYGLYRFHPKWQVKGGIYLAEALHRKFKGSVSDVLVEVSSPISQTLGVSHATLNYSGHVRKFEVGVLAGMEFRMNRHVGFYADFTWGLTPYFSGNVPIEFTMRNIYFSVGATFRL